MNPAAQSQALFVARLALAALFLVAGIRKLMALAGTAGYFAKLGFPAPEVMVWAAIAVEIGGAALLIAGWQTRRAAWLLILFTAVATAMAHRFWEFPAAQYAAQLNNFLKNVAVIGGLLYVIVAGPGAVSVDQRPSIHPR
jgi:putative oxidoreductase